MLVTRPVNLVLHRVFHVDAFPGIGLELLHAEGDTLGLAIEADHLNIDGLADAQDLGRVIDPAPGDVGDVEKAVEPAEIDERTVVGDVLDHAGKNLSFGKCGEQLVPLFRTALFEDGAA